MERDRVFGGYFVCQWDARGSGVVLTNGDFYGGCANCGMVE